MRIHTPHFESLPRARSYLVAHVILAAVVATAVPVHAGGGYYIQAAFVMANQLNVDRLSDEFDYALGVSGEFGKFVVKNAALGLRLNYQNNTAKQTNRVCGLLGCFDHEATLWDTDVIEAFVDGSFWIPRTAGLIVGGSVGISRCYVSNYEAEWRANTAAFELFSGAQVTMDELMLSFRVGYSFRDFGSVGGTHTVSGEIQARDLDFSCVFVEFGVGAQTRRGWGGQ